MGYEVVWTRRAERHVAAIVARSVEDGRDPRPLLAELEEMIDLLEHNPKIREIWRGRTRKYLLPTTPVHVYYRVEGRRRVVLQAAWHAKRGSPPPI